MFKATCMPQYMDAYIQSCEDMAINQHLLQALSKWEDTQMYASIYGRIKMYASIYGRIHVILLADAHLLQAPSKWEYLQIYASIYGGIYL